MCESFISPVPRFITGAAAVSVTNTSAVVNITYNENIMIGRDSNFTVTVSINPGGITRSQALSFPNQSISLNGLRPSTNYDGTVEVANNTGVTVDRLGLNFDTMSGESLSTKVSGCIWVNLARVLLHLLYDTIIDNPSTIIISKPMNLLCTHKETKILW